MSSQDVIKAVSKKLKYYFEVKRLEDGFDLSGPECPRLDHPPLKARPTLMYDGLHDRPLKHYFNKDEIRVALTQFKVRGDAGSREAAIRKLVERYLRKYHFVNSSLCAAFYNQDKKGGRKLKREVQGYGIPLRKSTQHHRGGYPVLRSVPTQYASRGEAERLVSVASKLLLAVETVDLKDERNGHKQAYRPKSAASSEQSVDSDKLPVLRHSNRPKTSKSRRECNNYSSNTKGRGASARGSRNRDEQPDSAYSTRPGTGSTSPSHTAEHEDSDNSDKDIKPWLRREITKSSKTDDDETWVRNVNPPETYVTSRSQVVVEEYNPEDEPPAINTAARKDEPKKNNTEQIHKYDHSDNILHDGKLTKYRVHVFTGQTVGAGTKADIKISLVGEKGRTEEMILDKSRTHKVKFQKGQEDIFDIDCYFVGQLKKIFIGHDQTEMGTDWFLDHVVVKDLEQCYQYYITCDTWLSSRSGDKLTFKGFPVNISSNFSQEEEEDRSQSYEEQQETHIAIVHTKPRVEQVSPREERTFNFERRESDRGTSTRTKYSDRTPTLTSTDSDTTTTYTTSDTTTPPYTPRGFGRTNVVSPNVPPKKKNDDFFDQQVTDKDYSSVIESLSVTTDLDNQDRLDSSQQPYSNGSRPQHQMTLRPVENNTDQTEESSEVRGQADSSDSEGDERAVTLVTKPDDKQTLFDAARNGDLTIVKDIIGRHPEWKNENDERDWSLLHIAADAGHSDIVQWLTLLVVDLETETPTGYTPMHLAAMRGHTDCLRILFSMGAAVNSRNHNGETPLYMAAKHGQLEAVKYLVSNKAEIEVRDILGNSAIDVAKSSGIPGAKQCYHYLKQCLDEIQAEKKAAVESTSQGALSHTTQSTSSIDSSSSSSSLTSSSSSSPSYTSSVKQYKEDEKQKHDEEIKEKRRLYEEQQAKMAKSEMTFLDSIRSDDM